MKLSFLLTICCLTLLFSCNSNNNEIALTTLEHDLEVDAFNDTIFFGNVICLLEERGDVYFTDHKNVRMLHIDKDLNFLNIIGKSQGRGPKDLGYIESFDVSSDTLWVGDVWKQAFVRFTTTGEFVDVVEQSNGRFTVKSRFTINGSNMYFSRGDTKIGTYLNVLNAQTGHYRQFGKIKDFGSPIKNESMNSSHIFVYNDWIISVPRSIPVIEVYDKHTLDLVESYDISHIPQIKAMYERALNNPNMASPNTFYYLTADAYLNEENLYLLVNVYEDDWLHSEILVLDVNNDMKLTRQYRLDEGIFAGKLCASNDYLYAFVPQINSIRRYPLK